MRKKLILLLIVLFSFLIIPINTNASKNDKVTIYLFRGQGCPHCEDFLNFLNNLDGEYADMFELESYEVWYDETNRELMSNISKFLEKEASGVPYIIIGKKVFSGYGSGYDASIKEAIKDLYETKKSNRYDVMTEYKKQNKLTSNYKSMDFKETLEAENIEYKDHSKSSNGVSSKTVIIWNLVFTIISTTAILVFVNYKFNKLSESSKPSARKTTKKTKE